MIVIAIFVSACGTHQPQAPRGVTEYLDDPPPAPEIPAVGEWESSRPKGSTRGLEVIMFPIVGGGDRTTVTYAGRTLRAQAPSGEITEKKLSRAEALRLETAIDSLDADSWNGGFFAPPVSFDGYFVRCEVVRGDERLSFSGFNGSPKGFASILDQIDRGLGADFFHDGWRRNELESKRYESFQDYTETTEAEARKMIKARQ